MIWHATSHWNELFKVEEKLYVRRSGGQGICGFENRKVLDAKVDGPFKDRMAHR